MTFQDSRCEVVGCSEVAVEGMNGHEVCTHHAEKMARPGGFKTLFRSPRVPSYYDGGERDDAPCLDSPPWAGEF